MLRVNDRKSAIAFIAMAFLFEKAVLFIKAFIFKNLST